MNVLSLFGRRPVATPPEPPVVLLKDDPEYLEAWREVRRQPNHSYRGALAKQRLRAAAKAALEREQQRGWK
jgi:hypothetical protein